MAELKSPNAAPFAALPGVAGEPAEGRDDPFRARSRREVVPDWPAGCRGGECGCRPRPSVERAVKRGPLPGRHAGPVHCPPTLLRIEDGLVRRLRDLVGFARRAGQAVGGFGEAAHEWLQPARAGLLVEARTAAGRGRGWSGRRGLPVVAPLPAMLGGVFGRDHAVHVAIAPRTAGGCIVAEAADLRVSEAAPPARTAAAPAPNGGPGAAIDEVAVPRGGRTVRPRLGGRARHRAPDGFWGQPRWVCSLTWTVRRRRIGFGSTHERTERPGRTRAGSAFAPAGGRWNWARRWTPARSPELHPRAQQDRQGRGVRSASSRRAARSAGPAPGAMPRPVPAVQPVAPAPALASPGRRRPVAQPARPLRVGR